MPLTLQELESEALRLPETSRAQLAERLLQSLGDEEGQEVERVWIEEAKERREDLRRNPTPSAADSLSAEGAWAELERLGEEIGRGWQAEESSADLLSRMRR